MILTEREAAQIREFFPEKCFYYCDKREKVPMGSVVIWTLVKMGLRTREQICKACGGRDECAARMDRVR